VQLLDLRTKLNGRRSQARLVTPLFVLVMLSTFAYFVSVGTLIPTLPRYVEGPLGGSELAVGLAIGSFALSAVIVRPFVGTLGDAHGRRVLMVAGAAVVAASVAAYGVATSLLVLVLLRAASGLGEAAFYVGAASVINDLAPDERRGEALSYFSLALYGGLAAGPVLGEIVLGTDRFVAVWFVAAASAAGAALLGAKVPDTRSEASSPHKPTRILNPAALLPGIVLACSVWGLAGFNTFVPLYALTLGLGGSRTVFVVYSAIVLGIRSLGARIPDRLGPARSARIALAVSAAGLAVIALWQAPPGLFAGAALFAVGQALAFPALMTIAIRSAPASERGAVVGTFTAFFDFAFGAGSMTLGAVAEGIGYEGAFAAAAAVAAGGVVLMFVRARRAAAIQSETARVA
jgi:MFS family permease